MQRESLARRLRTIRADHDPRAISQMKVARKAGLAIFRYWQIENGEGPEPTKDEKQRVAAALGVTVTAIDWPAFEGARASA